MTLRTNYTMGDSDPALALDATNTVVNALGVSITDFGAVSGADSTTAIQAAITAAAAQGVPLHVPAGTFLSDTVTVSGVANFRMDMVGRIKRLNASTRDSLLILDNLTNARIGTIRTDGNIANNTYLGANVDESKHDVSIRRCTGISIDLIDSINPAGDTVYIAGSTNVNSDVYIGHVSSVSTGSTGRNAVSIIAGSHIQIGSILSVNTGTTAMPSGLDLEPNASTDLIDDVQIGSLSVRSAGTTGLGIFSIYGRIITNVAIGQVHVVKTTGVGGSTAGLNVRGASRLSCPDLHVEADGVGGAAVIDDSDNVNITMHLSNSGGNALVLGPNGSVDKSMLRGSIRTAVTHLVDIYQLNDSLIDMTLRDAGAAGTYVVKTSLLASSNVTFKGDWSKGSTGLRAFGGGGSSSLLSGWVLDGVDFTGWGAGARITGGSDINTVVSKNCRGLNFGTAAPNFDQWPVGATVLNTTTTAGLPIGWVNTVAGAPATGSWQPFGQVAQVVTSTTAALAAIANAINTAGKYVGKTVYNTTTKKLVTADAATAAGVWVDATGTTAHTPV